MVLIKVSCDGIYFDVHSCLLVLVPSIRAPVTETNIDDLSPSPVVVKPVLTPQPQPKAPEPAPPKQQELLKGLFHFVLYVLLSLFVCLDNFSSVFIYF